MNSEFEDEVALWHCFECQEPRTEGDGGNAQLCANCAADPSVGHAGMSTEPAVQALKLTATPCE